MTEQRKEDLQQTAAASEGSLLDEIMQQTRLSPSDESYAVARRGVEAFIAELLEPKTVYEKADKNSVDQMIAEIDQASLQQIDEILHHKDVQKLESAWRGLKFLVDRTDFRENIKRRGAQHARRSTSSRTSRTAPEIVKQRPLQARLLGGVRPVRWRTVRGDGLELRLRPRRRRTCRSCRMSRA
jgi:type VI secretion system protein ImpC